MQKAAFMWEHIFLNIGMHLTSEGSFLFAETRLATSMFRANCGAITTGPLFFNKPKRLPFQPVLASGELVFSDADLAIVAYSLRARAIANLQNKLRIQSIRNDANHGTE